MKNEICFKNYARTKNSKMTYLYTLVDSTAHKHADFYEFAFVINGSFVNEFNGHKNILPQNTLAFFYKGTEHGIFLNEPHSVHFSFLIEQNYFEDAFSRFFPDIPRYQLGQYIERPLTKSQGKYLTDLANLLSNNANAASHDTLATLYLFTALSICLLPAPEIEKPKSTLFYAQQLLERLNNFSYLTCSVNEIYRDYPIAQSALIPQFKKLTGYTIVKYLNIKKMEYAEQLLVISGYPVSKVCSILNYSNFSHFSKQFKAHYGMTPKEYQRLHSRVQETSKEEETF